METARGKLKEAVGENWIKAKKVSLKEASTHMAVAALVASDSADAGMGIYSAAQSMGLDFIPVGDEWYEFAIPECFMELPHVQAFIEVLKSDAFKAELECLGGYGTERAGEIRWIN